MWIKCSSLLPKEGMLVIVRETVDSHAFYNAGIVTKYDENQSCHIYVEDGGALFFNLGNKHLEWKEVEKE